MSTGLFTTNQLPEELARKSFAGAFTRLMPDGDAPLFGLTAMLKSETALQIEHGFFYKTMVFPKLTVSAAGQLISDTIFTVAATTNIIQGQILRVDTTGENVIINSVLGPTQVAVQRGLGTVPPAAIGGSVDMFMVGNAYEQASLRPTALAINAVRVTNLTQIFRNTWAVSETVRATQVIAGDTNVAESRMEAAAFHSADAEKAIFWGQKFFGVRNNQPFHTLDGLINLITAGAVGNVTTLGPTTSWTQLEAALDKCFDVTSSPMNGRQRIVFCGGRAIQVINQICRLNGNYQFIEGTSNETNSYGLQFKTLKSSRGTFRLIEHPLFNAFGNASTWAKMAVCIELGTFNLAYLQGRQTSEKEFNSSGTVAQDNGIDAVGGTLTTEFTVLLKNPGACAILYSFTQGVKDP